MCGICGIVNFSNQTVASGALNEMMQLMKHRGPDDEGIEVSKNVGIGHVRLSIIDLSEDGKQPMLCKDNRYAIAFNGEIYNYLELKEELQNFFDFRTKTDTEVLLNAYKHWGASCLDHLNGMFAFVILDLETNELFIARDRFGIKPLYYFIDSNRFLFASEIKPILSQLNSVTANDEIIYDFLVHDRVQHSEDTFFQGVKKLQHGNWMKLNGNRVETKQWYDLRSASKTSYNSPIDYNEGLVKSLSLRMRSDVKVGACLSGGLDSSTIVSLMLKKLKLSNFHTFSAVYGAGKQGDESEYIAEYKNQVNKLHNTTPTLEGLMDNIETYVETLEEPVPGLSEYAEFELMKLAKDKATVVLNGQGADEVLAGYHYFFGYYFKELLKSLRISTLFSEIYHYGRIHKSALGIMSLVFFLLPSSWQRKASKSNKKHINFQKFNQLNQKSSGLEKLYNSKSLNDAFYNHFEYKFEHHLLWGDKSSMKQSIELRFPFLDHNHVENTIAMSSNWKINKGVTKYVLREAMKNILPEKIRNRQDKVGFETPTASWLRSSEFSAFASNLFKSTQFNERGYFNPSSALELLDSHASGKSDHSKELWKMVHLELWFKKFIDGKLSTQQLD